MTVIMLLIVVLISTVSGIWIVRDVSNDSANRTLKLLCETGQKNLNHYFKSVEQSVEMVSAYVESDLNAGGSFIWGAFSRSIRESTLRKILKMCCGTILLFVGDDAFHRPARPEPTERDDVGIVPYLTKSGKSDILISETVEGVETLGALGAAVSFLRSKMKSCLAAI